MPEQVTPEQVMQSRARVGREAPDFCLPAAGGEKVSLHGLRGRAVVLLFLPEPWTRAAEAELRGLERLRRSWGEQDVVAVAVSCDSLAGLEAFARRLRTGAILLSDCQREVCRLYGVLSEDSFGPQPAVFVVDPQGTLCHQQVTVPELGRDFAGLDGLLRWVVGGLPQDGEAAAEGLPQDGEVAAEDGGAAAEELAEEYGPSGGEAEGAPGWGPPREGNDRLRPSRSSRRSRGFRRPRPVGSGRRAPA